MIEKILKKLEVSDKELEFFRKEKTNYNINDTLFIKNDKKYKVIIRYDINNISSLFKKEIEKDELLYDLKVGNKYIIKNGEKRDLIRYIKCNVK